MTSSLDASLEYLGRIINIALQPSNIAKSFSVVQLQRAQSATKFIPGENLNDTSRIDISSNQLLLAQFHPLVVYSESIPNFVILQPGGFPAGNNAAYFLQQTFGLRNSGDAAMIFVCQSGEPSDGIVLCGNTEVLLTDNYGIIIVSIAAGVVGDSTNSTVIITPT
jgi:hypothetical protein